jgi:hypothetical protein
MPPDLDPPYRQPGKIPLRKEAPSQIEEGLSNVQLGEIGTNEAI